MITQVFTAPISKIVPFSEGSKTFLLRAEIDINTNSDDPLVTFEANKLPAYREILERAKAVLEGLA
jgi:hypothetical protein